MEHQLYWLAWDAKGNWVMCENAQHNAHDDKKRRLESLKRHYDTILNEEIPPRLATLVEKLKERESRKKNGE